MSNNQENQNIVLGFIVGAAAGLAAGILLAPESGQETRRTIAKKATDLKDKANTLSGQVGSQINNTISKITKKDKTSPGAGTNGANAKKSPKKPAGQSNPNIDMVS